MNCHCSAEKCEKQEKKIDIELILNIIGIIIFGIAIISKLNPNLNLILFLISYLLIGYEIIFNAIKGLFRKNPFDENFLMVAATIGAFGIGEYIEGIAVLIFYRIGEFLQDLALDKSKKRIEKALNLKPELANLKVGHKLEIVDPKILKINDIIVIKTGEKVPVDGVIIKGNATLDVKALTGESLPKSVKVNDQILSGSINMGSLLEVKVLKSFEDSTVSKIIDLIENANNNKSEPEKFITKFAKIYTPIVILIALVIALIPPLLFAADFAEYLRRALIFLVISCPCALVLSIPLGYFAGIGTCGKKGILVKGSNYLDDLININTIIFDKTGTLTQGNFTVTKIVPTKTIKKDELLRYIALCESYSNHPLAKSIISYYSKKLDQKLVVKHEEISGHGIKAEIFEKEILVGNDKLLDKFKINYTKAKESGTIIYLAVDHEYQGYIVVADEIKTSSIKTIQNLKQLGINNLVMLTGDNENIAQDIAKKLKLTAYYAELLPEDKVAILEKIKAANQAKVLFVGDGINDSPVLATSDIGVSMGDGSDIAIEAADIVLMTNEPYKIVEAITIAQKTRSIVLQNIIFSISIKVIFLFLSGFGLTTMWLALFADVGVSLIAILNSMRIMK